MECKVKIQCTHCPWKKSTNPLEIPGGYSEEKHAGLSCTLAPQATLLAFKDLKVMACHGSPVGAEEPCVGWLDNQLGLLYGELPRYKISGEQHQTFAATLPTARQHREFKEVAKAKAKLEARSAKRRKSVFDE